jgi:hypothetical protein
VYRSNEGVTGNARLTGGVAAALLVLLAAEGATIPFIGQLLGPHVFIGMLLIPPVLLKLGSTGYRFARYYSGNLAYVRKGPPNIALRVLAPGAVFTTLALFGTGVALLLAGPPSNTLKFAHKLSFIAWVALMTLHVLGTCSRYRRWRSPLAAQWPTRGATGGRRRPHDDPWSGDPRRRRPRAPHLLRRRPMVLKRILRPRLDQRQHPFQECRVPASP